VAAARPTSHDLGGEGRHLWFTMEHSQTNAAAVAPASASCAGSTSATYSATRRCRSRGQVLGERNVTESMQSYWTRFGATGDPGGEGAGAWPVFDATERYLEIAEPLAARTEPHRAVCEALSATLAP